MKKEYECIKDFLNYKVGTIFIDDKEHSRSRGFNRRHFSNKEYFKEVLPLKTIRERLQELPDGYRELAMQYEDDWGITASNIQHAIISGIPWTRSKEGNKFWKCIYHHYKNGTPLPPLPQKGRWKPKGECIFYVLTHDGVVLGRNNYHQSKTDVSVGMGNSFQTEEQAEAYKYLVEHEQTMYDTRKGCCRSISDRGIWYDCYGSEFFPSKFDVPVDRTEEQREEHKKKLVLVYGYLFYK